MSTDHSSLTGANLHVPGYFQSADPGAVGAGKYWVDTTGAAPYPMKIRNAANTAWEAVGGTGGGAPTTSEYLVGASDAGLSAERVVTDTPSITWDLATAAQAKAKRAALTGDVTASADSNATTIANDAVTFAKFQDVAANSVPARAAGTSGDLSEVALAASQLLGRGATGDVAPIGLGTNLSMSGTTLNASGGGLTEQDKIDLVWQKKFFSDASLLPATERIAASLATFPTEAGVLSGTTFTKSTGVATFTAASGDELAYWDLGALRSQVLVVIGGFTRPSASDNIGIFLSASAPAAINPDGYLFVLDSSGFNIYEGSGGSLIATGAPTAPNFMPDIWNVGGMAFYYDDATGALKGFVRYQGSWFLVTETTDSTYTTTRYVSIRYDRVGAGTLRMILPFTARSE